MAKEKIPYTEPTSSQDELQIKEIVAGTYLKDRAKTIYNNRYGETKTEYDAKSLYEISEGEVHYKIASSTAQMAYLPEYGESKSANYQKLTFTPPIGNLQFVERFDYLGGSSPKDFPYGIIAGSISRKHEIVGYNGRFDAIAFGSNADGDFVFNESLRGKSLKTFIAGNYPPIKIPDNFYVVLLGKDLKHLKTLKYPLFEYVYIKMNFYNDRLFLLGVNEFDRNTSYGKILDNIAVSIEGKVVYKSKIEHEEKFDFIRTHKYILAYSKNRFVFVNMTNDFVVEQKLDDVKRHIVFNPVLKTICVYHKNNEISVYKFYIDKLNLIKARQKINPDNEKYTLQWHGNLDYDYGVGKGSARGHYLREIGEYEADYEVGHFIKPIYLELGCDGDYYLNNTDDGDVGLHYYLQNRRFKTKIEPHINASCVGYVRLYRERQIVFFTLKRGSESGGHLFLFKY